MAIPRNIPSFPPWTVPIITTDTNLRKYDKKQSNPNTFKFLFWELSQRYQDHTHVYTDGSKTQNGTGYSIVFEHSTTKDKLHQDTSILTAELNALKYALETTSKYHNRKFAISCDSTNAIALDLNQWTNNTIHKCQNAYIESIKNNNSITVILVPSHRGIEMNERADKADKKAAHSIIPYHNTNLPLDSLLVHLKQKIKHYWNNE